jgi:hypothetical protein
MSQAGQGPKGQAKHPVRAKEEGETWVLGSQLQPDEQRYVLELFPESRQALGMAEAEWLAQTEFLVKKDGSLDLRKRYCRLPAVPGEPDRRYHRSPRYEPLPAPPQRQQEPQPQPLPPGVRPIVEEALASGDLVTANERLHQLSGGKTVGQVAEKWAGKMQPPEPRLSRPDEEQTYTHRVWTAYRALCEEMQTPDVPIHALHRRVGGPLLELQNHLRAECLAHRAAPSTGEPTLAGDAARQSALCLPGETDRATGKPQSFLLIKLIDAPPMSQPQQLQPTVALAPSLGRRLTRDDLDVIIEALEYRCDAIESGTDFDETARLKSIVPTLKKLRALEAQPQRPEHERYQSLLRAMAALRYPAEERTPELEARIEKTIARKVQEFQEERALKAYEASLRREVAQRHPNLTPAEAKRYEQRIAELVAEFRQKQRQPQQEQQRQARIQQQGRGIEQSL